MPPSAQTINPAKGLYIKLGTSGSWEKESIDSGILRFGYRETPFEAAVSGDWEAVRKVWLANRKNNEGVATSDVTQIRYFFEADVDTLVDHILRRLPLVVFRKAGRENPSGRTRNLSGNCGQVA